MRIAIISDIHGNLEALEAVLADVAASTCDDVRCLGDLVGYGADPNECVTRVREVVSVSLLGNHDAVAADLQTDDGFNDAARDAIRKTREALTTDSRDYLRSLLLVHETSELFIAHAHPRHPETWPYMLPGLEVTPAFEVTDCGFIAVGHSHVPGVADDSAPILEAYPEGRLRLENGVRYLFNPGSVGQPRDGDPRAAWGLLDVSARTYEQRRVAYDVETAQRKIEASGMPPFLAERLARGI